MSFQALARTWRPRRFDELVGQSHVVRALTHALANDKLHHALLFSGTRGVGKTTLARIIAKCLNCDNGITAEPCRGGDGACATCREIDEGRFIDLIEVDAASRTGVDDTRDLMDNVQYAPTRGRMKVYLIDEVHMLSKHSFNALLKTLEEPPPRVQFLLATTEPEKIPVTILSRCLQFPLKRLPVAQISAQLRYIVDAESLQAEDDALTEVARAADGSMRDGLSLLDQAIAFGGGALDTDAVRDMLGTIGQARVAELVDAIIAPDAPRALDALAALYAQGIDMHYLLDALATAWQHIATVQILGDAVDEEAEIWRDAAGRADSLSVQVFYDITLSGVRDLAYAPDPLVGVKMTVLRMLAFAPAGHDSAPADESGSSAPSPAATPHSGVADVRARLNARSSSAGRPADTIDRSRNEFEASAAAAHSPAPQVRQEPRPSRDAPGPLAPEGRAVEEQAVPADENAATAHTDLGMPTDVNGPVSKAESDHPEDWHRLVPRLGLSGLTAQLANNGVCRHMDKDRVVLELARTNEFLATAKARETLESALAAHWSPETAPRLAIDCVDDARDTPAMRHEENAEACQQDAVASIENDPIVRQLRDRLGAQVRVDTIKPNRPTGAMQQRDES